MLKVEALRRQADTFSALGDPTRLSLLLMLAGGQPYSIIALTGDTGLTRQAVAKHLHVLKHAGLVSSVRVGRESRYTCRPEALRGARNFLDEVSTLWDDALARLRSVVEDDRLA
jgi:DNA-binding transcriptional ArsR family regulator